MMNPNIIKLTEITKKDKRNIIGLMSGTSLDGLDVALCEVSGSGQSTGISLKAFHTIPYDETLKAEIMKLAFRKEADLQQLCLLNERIGALHGSFVNDSLKKWGISNVSIDLVASHGQTVFHAPKSKHRQEGYGNATLQIGDGDHLARATGIICISDFRQKHVAAGGEGAPLAVYGDYLLFGKKGENRVILNIGGIANLTYLHESMETDKITCTDTGPGNTIMDAFLRQSIPGKHYDKDAAIAQQGTVHEGLLAALKDDDFFRLPVPRTTGPEWFNTAYLQKAMERSNTGGLPLEDIMATLNKFTADSIASSIRLVGKSARAPLVICSGGGIHNPLLMKHLREQLKEYRFETTAIAGIDPDAKEAVLFALLANECICGDPSVFENKVKIDNGMPAITMGKISFPH